MVTAARGARHTGHPALCKGKNPTCHTAPVHHPEPKGNSDLMTRASAPSAPQQRPRPQLSTFPIYQFPPSGNSSQRCPPSRPSGPLAKAKTIPLHVSHLSVSAMGKSGLMGQSFRTSGLMQRPGTTSCSSHYFPMAMVSLNLQKGNSDLRTELCWLSFLLSWS